MIGAAFPLARHILWLGGYPLESGHRVTGQAASKGAFAGA
jgi:hypothetical protein